MMQELLENVKVLLFYLETWFNLKNTLWFDLKELRLGVREISCSNFGFGKFFVISVLFIFDLINEDMT